MIAEEFEQQNKENNKRYLTIRQTKKELKGLILSFIEVSIIR
jgi:hypothetical protein